MPDNSLARKKCKPCEDKTGALSPEQSKKYLIEIPQWILHENKIEKEFVFKDFSGAIVFINKVADIAEDEGHHPDINLHGWNKVNITLSTHSIRGLSENDFILASKIDEIYS